MSRPWRRRAERAPHPTTTLTKPWDGEDVEIDTELVGLILAIWRLDLCTSGCCQETRDGRVFLEFEAARPLEDFCTIIASFDDGPVDLYAIRHRMAAWVAPLGERDFGETVWKYHLQPVDITAHPRLDLDDEFDGLSFDEYPAIEFFASVCFPRSDLAEVTRRAVVAAGRVTPTSDGPS